MDPINLTRPMLLAVLKENPSIRVKSEHLTSTNAAALVTAVASEQTDEVKLRALIQKYEDSNLAQQQTNSLFADELFGLRGKRSVQRYRERLIDAYHRFTPTGRINNALGFRRINRIEIEVASEISIHFTVEKGEPDPLHPPAIFVSDLRNPQKRVYRQLAPDGTFRQIPSFPKEE